MARYRPDQDEDDGGNPCACGTRCAEGDYQGNPALGPRAFCRTDWDYIGRAVITLPEMYTRLWLLLPRSEQAEERVSGSREAPLPLAADVQAFLREIVTVACSWEDQVAAVARLSDYPDGRRRDAVALTDACRTLYRQQSTLLSLPEEDKVRFVPPATLRVMDPEIRIFYDSAGDAWEHRKMDGTAAGLEFLAIQGRARGMLGLTRQRRRITEVACDGCSVLTLVQYEARDGGWEEAVRCTNCPNSYTGHHFALLMGRVYQAQLAKLDAEKRRRAAVAA